MKSVRFVSVLIAGLCCILSQAGAANMPAVNEVLKLKAAGLSEESIVAFVKKKNLNNEITADDAIYLKDQGVTSAVLSAMFASGKETLPPAVVQTVTASSPAATSTQPSLTPQSVPVARPALSAEAAYFYQELSPYGRWILTEDNQWYWQPSVVAGNPGWRPYWDRGHWIYSDSGWYWASDYPWGWAAFHYGRWHLHPHHGWLWLPDQVWAPAWVVWRSGGDYCGWAPLPPGSHYDLASGRFSFHGKFVDASFDFGLDWVHFGFTYVRELGEQPRPRFRKEQEVRAAFHQTTIINNYTVKKVVENNQPRARVFNQGIDPGRVPATKGHPPEPVRIQDLRAPAPNRAHEHLDRQNKTLEVYRPKLGDPSRR